MKVHIRSHIIHEIARDLRFGMQPFKQEEGGYLAGRFDGETLEIVDHWRDLNAQRSTASIKMRESHLDFVTERIEQSGIPDLYVVGTWHVHPPGYGTRPSATDEEYLFLEHAAIHAGGLVNSRLPQAHLILGWGDVDNYNIYTMQVQIAGLQRTLTEAQPEHLHAIQEAMQEQRHAGILVRSGEKPVEPYTGPGISEEFATGNLDGFFWLFPYPSIEEQVEHIYLANFLHHVRQAHQSQKDDSRDNTANLIYYRVTLSDSNYVVTPYHLQYSLQDQAPQVSHISSQISEEITVLLSNPDIPEETNLNFEVPEHFTIGDIGTIMQETRKLTEPPILSTRRPKIEEQKWRQRTVMDEFGEVLLPDDVKIVELLDQQSDGTISLYWRSSELHPDMIYNLRTQRLQGIGYNLQRLKDCTVLVAGLGLLGSEMIQLLVAGGLGKLIVVDHGTVDFTNIYRQRLYAWKDVYQTKVDVALRYLSGAGVKAEGYQISIPSAAVNDHHLQETLATLESLVAQSDLVIGTLDSFSSRAVLQTLCLHRQIPYLSIALDLFDTIGITQASIFLSNPKHPGCYACGRSLAPALDSGVCTIAPLEFPPIASGFAFRLAMDVLHGKVNRCRSAQIYSSLSIEEQEIGDNDPECEVCGTNGLVVKNKEKLYQNIQTWLQGNRQQPR